MSAKLGMSKIFNVEDYIKSLRDQDGKVIHIGGEDFYSAILSLIELFGLQESFQEKAMANENGLQWWEVKELKGKRVDYQIASFGEIGEGIHSLGFKWWAQDDIMDQENFITEIVDALHFEASEVLKNIYTIKTFALEKGYYSEEDFDKLVCKSLTFFGSGISNSFGTDSLAPEALTPDDNFDLIKHYMFLTIKNHFIIKGLVSDDFTPASVIEDIKEFFMMLIYIPLIRLFEIGISNGVTFNNMLDRYKLKNALNQVRKMNGYKEGVYIKMWPSITTGAIVEDNVVAIEEVFGKDLSFDVIIERLNNYYNEYVKPSM